MGADLYKMRLFFGIAFDVDKVVEVLKAIEQHELEDVCIPTYEGWKLVKKTRFEVCLIERQFHCCNEWEHPEETLVRCSGFIGFTTRLALSHEKLNKVATAFEDFIAKNAKQLGLLGIVDHNPQCLGGIKHMAEEWSEDIPRKRSKTEKGGGTVVSTSV